jgi:hypothetical protein
LIEQRRGELEVSVWRQYTATFSCNRAWILQGDRAAISVCWPNQFLVLRGWNAPTLPAIWSVCALNVDCLRRDKLSEIAKETKH